MTISSDEASTAMEIDSTATLPPTEPQPGVWRRFAQLRVPLVALVFLGLLVLIAVLAPWLASQDPIQQDTQAAFRAPSGEFPLGSDRYGRDILSLLIYGARTAVLAVLYALTVTLVLGVAGGLLAGFLGGWVDKILSRIADVILSLPGLVLAIALIAVLGPGLRNAMIATGLIMAPTMFRVVRAATLAVTHEQFIDAARTMALSRARIMVRHVLPNAFPAVVTQTAIMVSFAIMAEAGLSFLGLGTQEPDISWGMMLSDAAATYRVEPWAMIPPGVAIAITVLAANLVGDGVNDVIARKPMVRSRRRTTASAPATSSPTVTFPAGRGALHDEPDPKTELDVPLLAVRNVAITATAGSSPTSLVTDLSFDIRRGETLALIGESGSGKTLTALAVVGLLSAGTPLTGGSIRLDGHELVGLDEKELGRIRGTRMSMIFQEPTAALNPAFTIGFQLTEGLRIHLGMSRQAARERAAELLDLVGIANPKQRLAAYPHELSGGMAQRVMIAIALSCDPELLVADEPTTALDVTIQATILDLLHDISRDRRMSLLIVTHDLGVVADVADRAAVMYAGQIVEVGPVAQVLGTPEHPYTEALLRAMPQSAERGQPLTTIPGTVPAPSSWPVGCRFAPRCDYAIAACRDQSPMLSWSPLPGSLDESAATANRCVRSHELILEERR